VQRVDVESAADLEGAVSGLAASADVVVMAAAVADFRPKAPAEGKLKKDAGPPEIVLEPTTDILAALGAAKRPGQTLVGFAAETDDLEANAVAKLRRKHLDLIVANDVSAPGAGFEHDTNEVAILSASGAVEGVPLADKRTVARAVVDAVVAARASAARP
jgi:phosphopantothenoylcysteine decarboxylase/phosphopantothenate--cysteine ligase